jgi:Zn-finger nucleic acid-binding protein
MLRQMDIGFWLERTEAETKELVEKRRAPLPDPFNRLTERKEIRSYDTTDCEHSRGHRCCK